MTISVLGLLLTNVKIKKMNIFYVGENDEFGTQMLAVDVEWN